MYGYDSQAANNTKQINTVFSFHNPSRTIFLFIIPLSNRKTFSAGDQHYTVRFCLEVKELPSGTGKSTHIKLWRKRFGKAVGIINGDKPLISVPPDEIRVWGTPWDGKEHWSANRSAPIAGICQIARGVENEICRVSSGEALSVLFSQTYRPTTEAGMRKTVQLLAEISQRVPFWRLKCNMSTEAAEVSYAAMRGEEI